MQQPLSSRHLPPGEGHTIDLQNLDSILPTLLDLQQRHGDHFKARFSGQDSWLYVLSHPDMARHVLARNYRNYRKGVGIDLVNVLLGRGIMVSEGDLWKRQRKMLQPMFNRDNLHRLTPLMTDCTAQFIKRLQADIANDEPVNITESTGHAALNFILYALFSEDLTRLIDETGSNPFLMVTDESARDLLFARRFRGLSKLILEMIERRKKENRRPFDILSMIMDASEKSTGEPMPQKQQLDETLTLIIAGHETTASALNWTWYLIAQHPEIEQRLLAEARQVLDGRAPSPADIASLTYTRQVLEEAMRLYPPGWLLTRRAIDEDEICGIYTPAGTDIFIPPYLVHRHPEFWENPEQFDPDRFAPEHKARLPQGAYLAFSIGPRNCIGEGMALYEMIIHISMTIQSIHLQLLPDQHIELQALVNLRSRHDLYMQATSKQ